MIREKQNKTNEQITTTTTKSCVYQFLNYILDENNNKSLLHRLSFIHWIKISWNFVETVCLMTKKEIFLDFFFTWNTDLKDLISNWKLNVAQIL